MKKQYLLLAIMAVGILGVTGCTKTSIPETIKVQSTEKNTIQVSTREEVKVVPDVAEIVFAVYSQAKDAAGCQTQNNLDVDKVLQVLSEFGIEEKSIQTSGYDLSPIYDWNGGQTITGYEMTTEVTVSDVVLDQVGNLISDCVASGVNNIRSVSYLSSQYDASYQEALKKAVETARVKAQALADAGNCTLGAIVKVEEHSSNQEARYTNYQRSAKTEVAMDEAGMAVMPGEVSVEAQITVEFEIK